MCPNFSLNRKVWLGCIRMYNVCALICVFLYFKCVETMFNNQKFSSPFGQNQQPGFGKPAAFGATGFGQQPTTLFNQPANNLFGQPAPNFGNTAPAFGQTATTQSAFGGK